MNGGIILLNDLILLGIVLGIILVLRRRDQSRSIMEQFKEFVEDSFRKLDGTVREKEQALKDYSINFEVENKTGRQVLAQLEEKYRQIAEFDQSLTGFFKKIESAEEKLLPLEENIGTIREELADLDRRFVLVDEQKNHMESVRREMAEAEKSIKERQVLFEKNLEESRASALERSLEKTREESLKVEEMIRSLLSRADSLDDRLRAEENEHKDLAERRKEEFRKDVENLRVRGQKFKEKLFSDFYRDVESRLGVFSKDMDEKIRAELRENHSAYEKQQEVFSTNWDKRLSERHASLQEKTDRDRKNLLDEMKAFHAKIRGEHQEISLASATLKKDVRQMEQNIIDGQKHSEELVKKYEVLDDRFTRKKEQEIDLFSVAIKDIHKKFHEDLEETQKQILAFQDKSSRLTLEKVREVTQAWEDEAREMESRLSADREKIESVDRAWAEKREELEERVRGILLQAGKQGETLKENYEELRDQLRGNLQELSGDLSRSQEVFLLDFKKELEEKVSEAAREGEGQISEYRDLLGRKLLQFDHWVKGVDKTEQDIRNYLKQGQLNFRKEMELFLREFEERSDVNGKKLDEKFAGVYENLKDLEARLNAIRERSQADITEKTHFLEEEFLADLDRRKAFLLKGLESLEGEMAETFEKADRDFRDKRMAMGKEYGRMIQEELGEAKKETRKNWKEVETVILEESQEMRAKIQAWKDEIERVDASQEDRIREVETNITENFRRRTEGFFSRLEESLEQKTEDFNLRSQAVSDLVQESREKIETNLSRLEGTVSESLKKTREQVRDHERDISGQYETVKEDLDKNMLIMKDEFQKQRVDFVQTVQGEYTQIRDGLKGLEERTEILQKNLSGLRDRSEEHLNTRLEEIFSTYKNWGKGIQDEINIRFKTVQQDLANTKEKIETHERKFTQQTEDYYSYLQKKLNELEHTQKHVVSHMNVFEKADSLEKDLSKKIDFLKKEIGDVTRQRKNLSDVLREFEKFTLLSEETDRKLEAFKLESVKINDSYKKILEIKEVSDSVGIKLKEIRISQDSLQRYQLKMRQLEEMLRRGEDWYKRLEEKEELITETTKTVDKNFRDLGKAEREMERVLQNLPRMTKGVFEVKENQEKLLSKQQEVTEILQNAKEWKTQFEEAEGRAAKVRELSTWMAQSETRLEEISREVRDKLNLFQSLTNKEIKKRKKAGGAPGMSEREQVAKLARQGWKPDEIARVLDLSRGEVELILQLSEK